MKNLESEMLKVVQGAIKRSTKTSGYDTPATVTRIEDDIAWVHIDGGVDETPVRKTIDAKEGDTVQVRVAGGKAWLTGNATRPPTDDATANYAVNIANETNTKVVEVQNYVVEQIDAQRAVIGDLEADTAKIHDLTAEQLSATVGYVGDLTAGNVTASDIISDHATVGSLDVADINAATAYIGDLTTGNVSASDIISDHATIGGLDAKYATIEELHSDYAEIDLANVNNAWIEDGVIKDAAISDAQIIGVSANKLTAGTIDASNITVTNLNASNITTGTINGQRIGQGSLSLDKLAENVYTEAEVDGMINTLQGEIDGAIETFTGTVVPTLNNYPANAWSSADDKSKHVGDVYYVVNAGNQADGYCYRFAYDNTTSTYGWILIKDSDVTAALSRLTTAEGNITGLQSFESETSSWISNTDEELSSIKQNHTSLVAVVDKTVKSSIQLWYSKSNTTAPNPPTSKITSTSTSGNAWRTVVPAYNASYPNYYYCWQYEYTDGTYGWSAVVRDIAMGETQATARTADATANANIKSTTMLWFTKSDTTAPSKPTAHVTTNNANTANAWNIAVPTYNASYPHYYYCYEYQKGDGSYSWSDVVYDRATSENQANSRSALSQVATKVETSTFNEVKQTVDENSASITSLTTTVNGKADSSTVTTLSNTVNSVSQKADANEAAISNLSETVESKADGSTVTTLTQTVNDVKQTATSNSSTISQLTTTLGTNADGTTKAGDIVHRTSSVEQDLSGFKTTVSQTYHKTSDFNTYKTSNDSAVAAAKKAGTDAQSDLNSYKTTNDSAVAAAKKAGDDAQADLDAYKGTVEETYATKSALTQTESSIKSEVSSTYATKTSVPTKVSQLSNDSKFATQTQAQGYANTAEGNAKNDTTEKLKSYSTTAQMNSAIDQKADAINLSVSQTYTTKTEFENLEIGGRNLLQKSNNGSIYSWGQNGGSFTKTVEENGATFTITALPVSGSWGVFQVGDSSLMSKIIAGEKYTLSYDIKTSDSLTLMMGFNIREGNAKNPYLRDNLVGVSTTANTWVHVVNTTVALDTLPESSASTLYVNAPTLKDVLRSFSIKNIKVEKGERATDWTPAPEDLESYADTAVSQFASRFSVTPENISSEVTSLANGSEIASRINQTANNVKIQASKVEIDGTAVFNAISGKVDDAITDKGYQTSSQVESAITSKGYQTASQVSTAVSNGVSGKADKTEAVGRTQRIYYRKTSSGAPSKNTTWLSTSGTGYGNWSLKIPQLTSGTTKYPYLYTAVQTQTVSQMSGTTCSCSDVLLDDTTTIIDGGTIITGTVNANAVNASSGTFDVANIPNLNASKITAGDIAADRMKANSITAINSLTTGKINAARLDVGSITVGSLKDGQELIDNTVKSSDYKEGSIVSWDNMLIDKLVADIEPIQDLNGYDHPWVGGAGKNKLHNTANSATINGVTFTVNSDGSIKVNGTATGNITFVINEDASLASDSYVLDITGFTTQTGSNGGVYVTNQSGTAVISNARNGSVTVNNSVKRVWLYFNSGTVFSNNVLTLQIRLASETDATYEPYSNICPISGHNSVDTWRSGRNLLDTSYGFDSRTTNGVTFTVNADKSITVNGTATATAFFNLTFKGAFGTSKPMPQLAGKTVTAKCKNALADPRINIEYFKTDGTNGGTIISLGNSNAVTRTIPFNFYSFRAYIVVTAGETVDNVTLYPQIELGTEASDYEPYKGETYTTALGRTVYGGTLDVVSGVLTVDRAMVDLGTLSWIYDSAVPRFYSSGIASVAKGAPASNKKANVICSAYRTLALDGSEDSIYGSEGNGGIALSPSVNISVKDTSYTNATAFKTAMNGVQLCYPLATPQTYQLTPQQVSALVGENNLWANSGTVHVTLTGVKDDTEAIADAAKTATNYITKIDDAGITIHPSGSTDNRVNINADGMEVFKGDVSVAMYGDESRIGDADGYHTKMTGSSIELNKADNTMFSVMTTGETMNVINTQMLLKQSSTTSGTSRATSVILNPNVSYKFSMYSSPQVSTLYSFTTASASTTSVSVPSSDGKQTMVLSFERQYEAVNGTSQIAHVKVTITQRRTATSTSYSTIGYSYTADMEESSIHFFGTNNILWEKTDGALGLWMTDSHTIELMESVSSQLNGIVLAWSYYNSSTGLAENHDWYYTYIPKSHVFNHGGTGVNCGVLGEDSHFATVASKYVYVSNEEIVGYANNNQSGTGSSGIKYDNSKFVLRYVLGV